MLRTIGSIVAGYIAMALFVFVTFTVAYLVMGSEGAFKPGSYTVTTLWIVVSIILGLVAALLGGLVCALITRDARAPRILAVLVLVLGVALAIPALNDTARAEPAIRTGDVGNTEAMQNAKQPIWLLFLNPLIGAVGVLVGSQCRHRR